MRETGAMPPAPEIAAQMVPVYLFLFTLLYWIFMRWRKRKLFLYFRALPPLEPGGPARCRLCGGPLPDRGVVRRCEYCNTDSIASEKILGRYAESLAGMLKRADDNLERNLLRNVKLAEHAYSYGGFYFLAFLPFAIFGTAVALVFLNNRYIRQRMEQYSPGTAIDDPSGNSLLLILVFIGMGIAFLAFVLPSAYRGVQDYRRTIAREIEQAEKEVE